MVPKTFRDLPAPEKMMMTLTLNKFDYDYIINFYYIMCHSISMRAEPAALRFDWSRVSFSMDLPVFVYSHMKSGLKFLSKDMEDV